MKKILALAAFLGIGSAIAQPKVVEIAIVKVKTEVTFPENFTPPGGGDGGGPGGGGGFSMPRRFRDQYYHDLHSQFHENGEYV